MARVDHRHMINDSGKLPHLEKLPRNERRRIEKESKKLALTYNKILARELKSGVGYPVDQFLREQTTEFTHRYASSGTNTQPIRFNYFEPFCDIRLIKNSVAPYAMATQELDHLFNVTDFFDYVTSKEADNFDLRKLTELQEGIAFHFTTNGHIEDFRYQTSSGRDFVVSGVSLIRRNRSLHFYVLGGEVFAVDAWKKMREEPRKIQTEHLMTEKRKFLEERVSETGYTVGGPVALEGTASAQRYVVAGEVDLDSHKYLGRCLLSEFENSFDLVCDDPEAFENIRDQTKREKILKNLTERMEIAEVLFSLAEAFFQLPSYFAFKVHLKKELLVSPGVPEPTVAPKRGKGIGAKYNTVSSLDIVEADKIRVQSFIPMHLDVETSGHWRRLTHGRVGKAADGSPEPNRTWIKRESTWRKRKTKKREIFVKSLVSTARSQVQEILDRVEERETGNIETDNHSSNALPELYVMRCLTMRDEVYKVGWTSLSAFERAKQLSSSTSAPTAFTVVKSWQHKDAEKLEVGIHALLDPYRISNRREFFQASFSAIEAVIENEIKRIS